MFTHILTRAPVRNATLNALHAALGDDERDTIRVLRPGVTRNLTRFALRRRAAGRVAAHRSLLLPAL